jgi:hypothetical protein
VAGAKVRPPSVERATRTPPAAHVARGEGTLVDGALDRVAVATEQSDGDEPEDEDAEHHEHQGPGQT